GGFYALPERRYGEGVLVVGDAAGFVDVPSLKGIHYAMQSGVFAARAIYGALRGGSADAGSATGALAEYDRLVDARFPASDLYRTRNMRRAFKSGFWLGGVKASVMTLTGGRFPGGRISMVEDAATPRTVTPPEPFTPDGALTFSKVDAVFKSGNATRDT